ncbi:MAG: hypothetical protein JW910_20495, partial [Anaerolineae bacterium]|nr:hypothetical protein [Anaerolineae bacterium]
QMGIGADFGQAQAYVATIFESLARSITGAFTLPLLIVAALLIGAGFVALIVAALARDPKEIDAGEVYALAASGLVSMPGVTPTPTLTPTVPDADHTPPDFPTPESPPPTRTLPPAPANVPPGDTPENDVPADEEDWSFP